MLVLAMGAQGCGKKAMPSPPGAGPEPVVDDLCSSLDGSDVVLTWTLPPGRGEGEAVVFRARAELGPEMCEGCPPDYQQVEALPFSLGQSPVGQSCRDLLLPGYRYTYKVVLKMDNGRTSAPSNIVSFDF